MDGLRGYAPQAYYADAANANGAPQPHHQYAMNGGGGGVSATTTRHTVVMTKHHGEISFGMTLEQHLHVAPTDFPRVSYVFPNSAAYRAGIQSGWSIEFINGASAVGRTVGDVASIFRNLSQVTLLVDTRLETPARVPALPAFRQPVVAQPQSQFPLGGESFASLLPPNMLGMSSALSSSSMSSIATTTMATMAPASVAYASVAQSHAPVAHGSSSQAYTVVTTHPVQTQFNHSPQINQRSSTSATSGGYAPAAIPAPPSSVAPVASTLPTTVTTSSSRIPEASTTTPTMILHVARSPAQAQACTTPPVAPPVVSTAPIASPAPTTVTPAPPAPPPAPQPQSASRAATALPVRIAHESAFTLPAVAPPPAATTTPSVSAPASNPPPSSGISSVAAAATSAVTGRRRRRSAAAEAPPAAAAPAAPARRRGRAPKRQRTVDGWDSDDAVFFCGSDDEVVVVESPQPNAAGGSRRSARQSESGGRTRRSLTITRLMNMDFTEEDAQASVEACGQDLDKCMLWIVSHLEEKQFLNDLNKASIESEQQKRLDAQEQKKVETETLRQATAFAALFPTSYILSSSAEAARLNEMLSSTIGDIAADTLMRTLVTKLLAVESKAIRWYKEAAKCYMLQLAERLETAYTAHDAVTCCSQIMATEPASNGCAFVRALYEEEQALTKALFSMPENHGGVPLEFLRADESMQFNLDDDGFEVMELPPAPSSPGCD